MISKGKFLQNANFYLPFYRNIFPFSHFIPKESCCILSSHLSSHCHCIKISFYLIHVIKNTSSNNHSCFCIICNFLCSYFSAGNIAINPSTIYRQTVLSLILCCFSHDAHTSFPPYSSASPPRQRLCPLSVHSTFCLDFLQ